MRQSKFTPNLECVYIVKHPEEHGRIEPEDPWSLRQMGVYHQTSASEAETFIILNPSKSFLKRLKKARSSSDAVTPQDVHMMILSAAMERWRSYISDLANRYYLKVRVSQGIVLLQKLTELRKPVHSCPQQRKKSPVC
jgi:hypothetical protein